MAVSCLELHLLGFYVPPPPTTMHKTTNQVFSQSQVVQSSLEIR